MPTLPLLGWFQTKTALKKISTQGLLVPLLAGLLTAGALASPQIPFNPGEQAAIHTYAQHFQSVGNQAQLLATYREALQLKKKLEPWLKKYSDAMQKLPDYPSEAELKQLGAQLPGLRPGLVAEGTMLDLMTDFAGFAKVAAKTPETADNAFFSLMQQAYGSHETYWGTWFNQTWDYGGCTWLGKGIHTRLLQGIQQQQPGAFGSELKPLQESLLRDLERSDKFCLPRPQVVQEFQQLLPLLPAAVRPRLQQRLQRVKTDPKLKEFDCNGKGNCSYG